jgi:hypothetical protein
MTCEFKFFLLKIELLTLKKKIIGKIRTESDKRKMFFPLKSIQFFMIVQNVVLLMLDIENPLQYY